MESGPRQFTGSAFFLGAHDVPTMPATTAWSAKALTAAPPGSHRSPFAATVSLHCLTLSDADCDSAGRGRIEEGAGAQRPS